MGNVDISSFSFNHNNSTTSEFLQVSTFNIAYLLIYMLSYDFRSSPNNYSDPFQYNITKTNTSFSSYMIF